jgi:hypothetical protein
LRRTIFPWKYEEGDESKSNPYTEDEMRELCRGISIDALPEGAARSKELKLTPDERKKLDEYEVVMRRWNVVGEQLYSAECEKVTEAQSRSCTQCAALVKDEGLLPRLNDVRLFCPLRYESVLLKVKFHSAVCETQK